MVLLSAHGLLQRQAEGLASTAEIEPMCPHCDHWTHSHFMNAAIRNVQVLAQKRKAEIGQKPGAFKRYKKAQKQYQRTFDRVNAHLRKKLGVKSAREVVEAFTSN